MIDREMRQAAGPPGDARTTRGNAKALLFIASVAALYFELVIIRYLASEIRVFAYLKNMPLVASFFGIAVEHDSKPRLRRTLPVLAAVLLLLIASALAARHHAFPNADAR